MEKKEIDWHLILKDISKNTTCTQAEEKVLSIEPYTHISLAQQNMNVCRAFIEILKENENQRVKLESFEYIESILFSIKKSQILTVFDLNQVRLFFEDIKAIKTIYPLMDKPILIKLSQSIIDVEPFLDYINQIISEDGEIRSDASPLLLESFNKKKALSQNIHKTLDKLVKNYELESILQDRYVTTREGRWVLPVISGKRHDFKGLVHDSSNSKETVFMEPQEIVSLNNKVRELEDVIKKEVSRLLKDVTFMLNDKINQIIKSYNTAIEIDVFCAIAFWAKNIGAKPADLQSKFVMEIKEGFHPLLKEDDETGKTLVKNDFILSENERILILSGPNAGGKTVFLKTVGLICQMARCGLPVCAKDTSLIPFFEEVTVVVGDNQSVEDSLSTFEAHLKSLHECTKLKSNKHFVLIDEICGATEAGEGSALARAFIETYSKNNVISLITSHLGPLKKGWDKESGVVNGSMLFNQALGKSTYEFIKGVPGDSLAIETAKKANVDQEIIDRALHFLTPEQRKKYSGLVEIESLQKSLKAQKESFQKREKELEALKTEYQDMIKGFKNEQDILLEQSIKRFQKNLNENQNYSSIQNRLKNKENLMKMQFDAPKIVKSSAETTITEENFSKVFPPGSQVYVPSLKKNGIVQGTPNNQGYVPIMSESMRLVIKWSDARKVKPVESDETKKSKPSGFKTLISETLEHEVDLRGMTVDESLSELEDAIDQTLRINCERLKVIHGHGTEKVKKNVRSFLSRHPLVKTWKSESSDGATIALF